MPKPSFAYAVGNVRAREGSLLTKSDLEQLLSQHDSAALTSYLRNRGFGSQANETSLDVLLREEREKLWAYVLDITPDRSVFEPFLYAHDTHNFKAILKGILRARDYTSLLMRPETISPQVLETAIHERNFSALPDWLADTADRAYTLFLQTSDAQLSDGILDVALSKAQLKSAKALKIPMLYSYFETRVFYQNVKVALRATRAEKNAAFLEETLCQEVPGCENLMRCALRGEEEVLLFLERFGRYSSAQAAEAFRKSPSEFERWVDNALIEIARAGKYTTLGAEPLISYLLARLAELGAVQIIASGIRTGQEAGQIRERLRDLYG